jgi:hypothetical protein
LQSEKLIERQEEAKTFRHHIVNNTLTDLSFSDDTASGTKQNDIQNLETVNVEGNDEMEVSLDRERVEKKQGKQPKELCDDGKSIITKEQPQSVAGHIIDADTTETAGSVPTHDVSVTSYNGVMTSHDGIVTSRDHVITSHDTSILMLQSLLRGFKARLRYKNKVEQVRLEVYKEYQEMVQAAHVIQRYWRGYSIR